MTGTSIYKFRESVEPFCILLVEDDIVVRIVIADTLREHGYRVLEASDGEEAIAIFNGRSDIDLLLTDVQMPGSLDGIELARRVRMQAADLKVIVVSGHLEASKADGLAHAFVPKPYGLAAMVEKVKELLKPI